MTYLISIEPAQAMDMASLTMIDLWKGSVVWLEEDGTQTTAYRFPTRLPRTEFSKQRLKKILGGHRAQLFKYLKANGGRRELHERQAMEARRAEQRADKEARGRLRDAAPDLYRALKDLITEPSLNLESDLTQELAPWLRAAHDAIAKCGVQPKEI